MDKKLSVEMLRMQGFQFNEEEMIGVSPKTQLQAYPLKRIIS